MRWKGEASGGEGGGGGSRRWRWGEVEDGSKKVKPIPRVIILSGSGLVVIWAWVKDWTRLGLFGFGLIIFDLEIFKPKDLLCIF